MSADEMSHTVLRMSGTLTHRGPDDSGSWVDAKAGVALGHRRLAIIDLSPRGRQPMPSASGRYIVVFNGEIYNFQDLRWELRGHGHRFQSASDTEVMLAAFEQWGIKASLERFNGMFAIAVWDRETRRLTLARDRFGEKPLYYGWFGNTFLFASEVRALRAACPLAIDWHAVKLCLREGFIPAPYSVYRQIAKLSPASLVAVDLLSPGSLRGPDPYWSARQVLLAGQQHPFEGSEGEAADQLEELARTATRLRMIADVGLGAFLSGGIDSSTVVALMQAQSDRPVKTFSVGFDDPEYNEAEHASAVAHHLGTEHTELYLSAEETLRTIPLLPALYDEPFADSSQIPTFLVSRLARQHVTVALSGDGGDEVFGGYVSHFFWASVWSASEKYPMFLRRRLADVLRILSPAAWSAIVQPFASLLPKRLRLVHNRGEKLHRLADLLSAPSEEAWRAGILSRGAGELGEAEDQVHLPVGAIDGVHPLVRRMMLADVLRYLPDDILVKVDRAAMSVSLETRIPFLDPDVFAFAARLPVSMLVSRWAGKLVLRKLLYRFVPRHLVDRPKRGFSLPLGRWLRHELRPWAESLLEERKPLSEQACLDANRVRELWRAHLSGQADHATQLWSVLMCLSWLQNAGSVDPHAYHPAEMQARIASRAATNSNRALPYSRDRIARDDWRDVSGLG